MDHRVVVVGGGSAGCVVASRLSEDPGTEVVLLEAGPDYPDVQSAPDDIRSAFVTGGTEHDWGYLAERGPAPRAGEPERESDTLLALRGKVMGGSSSVNGTSFLRAHPSDFDRWAGDENPAWAWDRVVGAFCRLEDDPMPGEWHGQGGPLHVHRFTGDQRRPVHQAFLDASAAIGYRLVDDLNAPDAIGAGPLPLNQVDTIRQSAAVTHLSKARGRPNLTIRSEVLVDKLEIVDGRPRAVVLADGKRIEADRVVLAAGSFSSPAILMRSGVGPAADLAALGIEPILDLPVGRRLTEHPVFIVSSRGDVAALGDLVPPIQVILSFTSDGSDDHSHTDLQVVMMVTTDHTSDWFQAPPGTLLFGIALGKPRSTPGEFRLASADPRSAPRIWLNFYEDPSDVERMAHAVGVVRKLLDTPVLAALAGQEVFPGREVTGKELDQVIVSASPSGAHATGTCRMGTTPATSVVDQTGRVHGLDDLWVIDASIIPQLPSVPTNFVTMMLAERCVAWLRGTEPVPEGTRHMARTAADGQS